MSKKRSQDKKYDKHVRALPQKLRHGKGFDAVTVHTVDQNGFPFEKIVAYRWIGQKEWSWIYGKSCTRGLTKKDNPITLKV